MARSRSYSSGSSAEASGSMRVTARSIAMPRTSEEASSARTSSGSPGRAAGSGIVAADRRRVHQTEVAFARCSVYSRMPVVARTADPSNDGRSTGFGILFHASGRLRRDTSPSALRSDVRQASPCSDRRTSHDRASRNNQRRVPTRREPFYGLPAPTRAPEPSQLGGR